MAKETITIVRDDIDGSEGANSYTFALGNDQYEIDLNDANYKKLVDALEPFVEAGAKVTSRVPRERSSTPRTNAKRSNSKEELTAMREWAKENGIKLSERGRIPYDVQKQYHEAKGD